MKHIVRSQDAPAPLGPYSQGVLTGNELYCSAQAGIDPQTGELCGSDVAAQAERALQNIGAVLDAAGMNFGDVVKTTLFLADMRDFETVNAVYARYFGESKPARSTIAVAALPKGGRVGIDAIARV